MEARCMKCKVNVEIKDPEDVVMKNGRTAVKGVCPTCGTKVFRITGKKKEEEAEEKKEEEAEEKKEEPREEQD